ncbi:MAG: methionine aminotransferase [Bacteroidota bacterium]|nr:methionine aminotransferase [Bacteroidota bacterium]
MSKLPRAGESIFSRMSMLAKEHGAINLAQGFPDFDPPELLQQLLQEATREHYNQYAPMQGLLILREQISLHLLETYQVTVDPEQEITITAGATQGVYTAISCLVSPGDKVIVFEPAYDSYGPSVLVNSGIPIYLKLNLPDFSIPWDKLSDCLENNNIRLIVINNPHNPGGYVWTASDYAKMEKLLANKDVIVLWDEVYDALVYDGNKHASSLQFPELFKKSINCFSFGKSLHCTGWKIGYNIAHASLTKEYRKLHQFTVFSVHTPSQYAIARFIEKTPEHFESLAQFYQQKRDYFIQNFKNKAMNLFHCSGSYFLLAKYQGELGDYDYCIDLIKNHQIAAIPISAFYYDQTDDHIIRFCFAKKEETLQRALYQLNNL